MWKEVVVTIFELLVLNFPGGTENIHERPHSEQPAFGPTYGFDASRIRSERGKDPNMCGVVQRGRYWRSVAACCLVRFVLLS